MATSVYDIDQSRVMGVQNSLSAIGRLSDSGLMIRRNVHNDETNASMNCSTEDPNYGPTPCALSFSRSCDDTNLSVLNVNEKVKDLSVSAFDWEEYAKPEEGALSFYSESAETNPPIQMRPPPLRNTHVHLSTFCSSKPLNEIIDAIRDAFKGKQYKIVENAFESIFLISEVSDDATCGFQINLYVDDSAGKSTTQYVIEAQHFTGCPWAFQKMFVMLQQAVEKTTPSEIVVLSSMTPTTMMDNILQSDGMFESKKSRDANTKLQSLETLQ